MSDFVTGFSGSFPSSAPTRPSLARRAAAMWDAWRTRRVLAELDPRQLKDIGVSRGEALVEAARAPWDIGPRR